ncbi:MAG: glycosyltransferase family 39 protein, partial [Rhodospirillales bacterium]|nr:glycosyltransferase family 39 protein [Rhodospirillales bacterium]
MTGAGDHVAAEGRIAETAVAGRAVGALGRAALGHPRSVVVWTILLGTALRVLFAATGIDIAHSEAYYTATARHLALGYFDHPALSFWLTHAARALAGSDSLLVLRAPYILLFAGTTWIIYRITARAFGEAAGACAAVLLNLSPLFTVSMAGWVPPDGPMLFCLAAAAWCVLVIADLPSGNRRKAPPLWLAAGALFGLAALAKYYAVLMGLGVALFALTSARHRGWFAQPWPYLALAIALLFFAPTIIWNVHNGWISFAFQGERAFGEGFSVLSFLD